MKGEEVAEEPVWYFAKAVLRDKLGLLATLLAVLFGLLSGVVMPGLISELLARVGKPEVVDTSIQLVAVFIVAGIVEMSRRVVTDKVRRDQRAKAANESAVALRNNAPVGTEISPQLMLSQFYAAQSDALLILTGDLPQLVVGLGGFLIVLVLQGVPVWVVFILALLIAAATSAYWPLRNSKHFKQMAEYDNKEIEQLAAIRSAWGMEQFQPALRRAQYAVTVAAGKMRRLGHKQQHGFVNARAGLNAAVGVVATFAAIGASYEVATLLFVFTLRFGGYLSVIHYVVEFLPKINVNAAELLKVIAQPMKPRLEVGGSESCLQTSGLSVTYDSPDRPENTVAISPVRIKKSDTVLFVRENGGGKTTFFRAVMGMVPYAGSLKLWGRERREFDIRHVVAYFSQVRIPLPVKVQDLFIDDEGQVDVLLMRRALAFASVSRDFDLGRLHNTLSGGQQQKIDLALVFYRALYGVGAQIVIFDEPTNNLDGPSVAHLWRSVESFLEVHEGCRLFTTHDPMLQGVLTRTGCTSVS